MLAEEIRSNNKKSDSLKLQISKLKEHNKQMTTEIANRKEEIIEKEGALISAKSATLCLRESFKQLEDQISIGNKSIETLSEENKTVLKSLQDMKKDLNRVESELKIEKDDVTGLKNKLSRTETAYNVLSAEITTLNKKFTACVEEQAETKNQLQIAKNEFEVRGEVLKTHKNENEKLINDKSHSQR